MSSVGTIVAPSSRLLFAALGLTLRLWARLRGPRLVIEGHCLMCGDCCRNLVLWHRGVPLSDPALFERMAKARPELAMLRPVRRGEAGQLVFDCSQLRADGRCAIHATRPSFCRHYPSRAYLAAGGELLEGCGYRICTLIDDPGD